MTGKKNKQFKDHTIILSQIIKCSQEDQKAFNDGKEIPLTDEQFNKLKDKDWFVAGKSATPAKKEDKH